MKILHIIPSLGTGGAEKLILDSLTLYKIRGIDVELLLLNNTPNSPFYNELKGQNIIIHTLHTGNICSVYNPLYIFKIVPYLKKYDLIHVHLFPALYWVAIAKILSCSPIRMIYTEHNTENSRRDKRLLKPIECYIYNEYNAIISITEQVSNNLKRHIPSYKGQFRIINNGINLSKFKKLSARNQAKDNPVLIQVSSFRKQKDQETLIKSMQYLPANVTLLLVGDGETRSKCEGLVKELNLEDKVKFLGVRMDIPQLLAQSDIVVLSSNYEGLSLSSIEGMASGCPFIASDVPGLNDVVGGAGLLFPTGDAKCLANIINKLLKDNEYYKEISQACLKRANEYDINKMVDQYIELYQQLLQ